LQCSLHGEGVLSLLGLLRDLLGLAGVVGSTAVSLEGLTERNLQLLAIDFDVDVSVTDFVDIEIVPRSFVLLLGCGFGGLSVSLGYPWFGTALDWTGFPFRCEGVVVRHVESFRLLCAWLN
jgi:hypothetical protein